MTVKQVSALIVAGLVAGVVLGSFGIAGAGGRTSQAAMPVADCATDCATASDCAMESAAEPVAAPGAAQGSAPEGAPECGGGACADCQ
jgi:hypothetical protein